MSDETTSPANAVSAGQLLQAARQARGIDLDPLAQLLKVPVRKLEALEADRHDELPGLAFVRSLALSYAKQIGIDPQPVLAALPLAVPPSQQLEKVTRGLQTPYREAAGGNRWRAPAAGGATVTAASGSKELFKPAYLGAAVLLVLALALLFAPPWRTLLERLHISLPQWGGQAVASAPAASAVTEATTPPANVVVSEPTPVLSAASANDAGLVSPGVAAAPVPVPAPLPVTPAASTPAAPIIETVHSAPGADVPSAAGPVVLRTTGDSWIEVREAGGKVLLSRTVPAGEVVGLDGAMPLRIRIGVASAVLVTLRGEPVNLTPFTRGTTATVVLK